MKDDIRPPKKIIDVTAPGKSAPSSTAKPVIVTNRPLVKDPMVKGESDETSRAASAPEAPADVSSASSDSPAIHKALVLKPTDDAVQAVEETEEIAKPDEPKKDESEDAKEASPTAKDEPEKAPEEQAPPEDKPSESDKPETGASEQTDDPQAKQPTPEDEAAAEAKKQAEHDAAIQKIVAGRQYFLPINMVEKRRTKQFVALGLVLAVVLALMWVDVALDAGLIHLGGIKPLTHFFST